MMQRTPIQTHEAKSWTRLWNRSLSWTGLKPKSSSGVGSYYRSWSWDRERAGSWSWSWSKLTSVRKEI